MDAKEIFLSLTMVASSFLLAYSYLAEHGRSNPDILASTVLLIAYQIKDANSRPVDQWRIYQRGTPGRMAWALI